MQTKWTGFTGKQLKSGALILVFLLTGTAFFNIGGCNSGSNDSGYEQVCERDTEAELCNHTYALCIAASCDPETIDGNTVYLFSPWFVYSAFYIFLSLLLYWGTVRRVRRIADK